MRWSWKAVCRTMPEALLVGIFVAVVGFSSEVGALADGAGGVSSAEAVRGGGKGGRRQAAAGKEGATLDPDKALYERKCGRCHEAFVPGVSEMTWNRWIWKWKDKARLTDEEYDRLMVYARREREARAARLAADGAGK